MTKYFERKKNRLDRSVYQGNDIYFITICSDNNKPIFLEEAVAEFIIDHMKLEFVQKGGHVLAYCLMPDHLHLLLFYPDRIDVVAQIKNFKQKTTVHGKKVFRERFWQKGYHDHVVRKIEDVDEIIDYILDNPVRKGIVDNRNNYRYSGIDLKS